MNTCPACEGHAIGAFGRFRASNTNARFKCATCGALLRLLPEDQPIPRHLKWLFGSNLGLFVAIPILYLALGVTVVALATHAPVFLGAAAAISIIYFARNELVRWRQAEIVLVEYRNPFTAFRVAWLEEPVFRLTVVKLLLLCAELLVLTRLAVLTMYHFRHVA